MTEPLEPVTGVAKGSEGTGTALDDTQEYDITTFMAPADAIDEEPIDHEPAAETPVVAAAPPARPVRGDRPRPSGMPLAVRAGLLTAVIALAVLFGASLAGRQGGDEVIGGLPAASSNPTAEPTERAEDGDAGGDNEGGGKGKGNGCGNGRGNGNNC